MTPTPSRAAAGVTALLCLIAASPTHAEDREEVADLYERVADAVVQIRTHDSAATGFLLQRSHLVVTAWHVVDGDRDIIVTTRAGDEIDASVIAWDPKDDVALLELVAPVVDVVPLELAEEVPRVGEVAYCIGQPFLYDGPPEGAYEGLPAWTLMEGTVAALGEHRVQTTIDLPAGSSGGPLLDGDGRVIGVATENIGGLGLGARVEGIRALQEAEPNSKKHVPVHAGGIATMALDGLPGQARPRRLRAGFYLETNVVLDRKLLLGVGARFTWLGNDDARQGLNPDRRFELGAVVGASFDLPFRPSKRGRNAVLQVYGTLGVLGTRDGTRTFDASFVDPTCNPQLEPCATTQDSGVSWARPEFAPMFGGGVRLNLGLATYSFEVGTSMTNPGEDFRIGFGVGFQFGGP